MDYEDLSERELEQKILLLVGDRESRDELIALRSELQSLLTSGAYDCVVCGNRPIGIHHPRVYEIGCSHCKDKRAFGSTRSEAVNNWNNENFNKNKHEFLRARLKVGFFDRLKKFVNG